MGIENFDDTMILIDANDKLPENITLKNVVILIICVIKGDDKFIHNYFKKKH